jgi:hypothetical protein
MMMTMRATMKTREMRAMATRGSFRGGRTSSVVVIFAIVAIPSLSQQPLLDPIFEKRRRDKVKHMRWRKRQECIWRRYRRTREKDAVGMCISLEVITNGTRIRPAPIL